MIRKKSEQPIVFCSVRGGIGEAEQRKIAVSDEELYGKGRVFNHIFLAPGNSIGEHTHQGDEEIYYVLSGSGTYFDNGEYVKIHAGDTTICRDGEAHGLVNDGDAPLEMIALILYV